MNQKKLSPNIPKVDVVEPFNIGNFYHRRSFLCQSLAGEARELFSRLGWDGLFSIYRHSDDPSKVRVYFRIAYVSTIFLDGTWEDIKRRMPELIPLIKSYRDLRQHADIATASWIEPNARNIDWLD